MKTPTRLLVLSPAYANFSSYYIDSLLHVRRQCEENGIHFHWQAVEGVSCIVAARNKLAHVFCASDYTHLLMIDSDIGYPASIVQSMLARDVPFCAAAPPLRGLRHDLFGNAFKAGVDNPERYLAKFCVEVTQAQRDARRLIVDDQGFIEVERVGGAFMLIRREVFSTLAEKYPELEFIDPDDRSTSYGFFDRLTVEKRSHGEDYSFCIRARQAGFKIHLLVDASMTHSGPYVFKGNYGQFAVR